MNVYCENCKEELEIMQDLGSELHVSPCSCIAAAQARAKTAEENWHKNEARLGRDGLIFMECMKLLGLDVSGTDPEAIPAAIKRLKGVA